MSVTRAPKCMDTSVMATMGTTINRRRRVINRPTTPIRDCLIRTAITATACFSPLARPSSPRQYFSALCRSASQSPLRANQFLLSSRPSILEA